MNSGNKYKKLGYDYHWSSDWQAGPYTAWVRQVLGYLPDAIAPDKPQTILDIGCGDGYPAHLLDERGFTVTGVDVIPEVLDVAREKTPGAEFRRTIPRRKFDYVLALDALEHIADAGPLVKAIMGCRNYAILTCPPPGLDPYAVQDYTRADIVSLFPGCLVEEVIATPVQRLYRITPGA